VNRIELLETAFLELITLYPLLFKSSFKEFDLEKSRISCVFRSWSTAALRRLSIFVKVLVIYGLSSFSLYLLGLFFLILDLRNSGIKAEEKEITFSVITIVFPHCSLILEISRASEDTVETAIKLR
jgi:hypothetical protein